MEAARAANKENTIQRERPNPNYGLLGMVDDYSDTIYRLCRSLTYSKEDADDLFQETFVKILEQPRKVLEAENPKGFLLSTAIYIWKSWKRKYARRNRLAGMQPMDENIPCGTSMEEQYMRQEEIRMVQDLVKSLPEKYRVPIILYYTLEMSVAEISDALNLPEGTVKSRLFKARRMLQKGLVESQYEA